MSILDPLAPYFTLVKWLGALAILSITLWGGCAIQKGRNATALAERDATIAVLTADKNFLADALNQVNAQAQQAQRDAAKQAKQAEAAVKGAAKDAQQYERDLADAERALQRARKSPECRAQLEQPLCVDLL